MNTLILVALAGVVLVAVAAVALDRFNRKLEAAMALPRSDR